MAKKGYVPELPETITAHYITFPSWEKFTEAGYKIGESEIALACDKLPPWMLALNMTENGRSAMELFSEIRSETLAKGTSILVIIGADCQRELDYKEKVLRQITTETGGEFLPFIEEPINRKQLIWHRLRATTGARETFRLMLSQGAGFGACDSWEFAVNEAKAGAECKQKYIEKGVIVDDGADNAWGTIYEHGHMGHMDELYLSDPNDPASGQAAFALMQEMTGVCLEKALGCPQTAMGDRGHDLFGPHMNNYHLWARKIKKAFDPNGTSESTNYITSNE